MQKNALAAIIFALASFLFFVLVLPEYDAIRVVREAVSSRQLLLEERSALLKNVLELNRQATARQSDINKIKSFLPERKQIDEIVSSLQKITEQSGLQLSSLTTSVGPSTGKTEFKKIFVGMDVIGTYPAFVNFLKLLEQSLRLYDVFEITAAVSTTTLSNINLAIKMNTYYLK